MSPTLPDGELFGFPLTWEEYARALSLVFPAEEVEMMRRGIYESDEEVHGVTLMDGDLLLLALLSAEMAERVVKYRPDLAEMVRIVREDPQRAIDSIQMAPD